MRVILYLDTSNNKEVTVGLKRDGTDEIKTQIIDHRKAQVVLPMVDEMLKKHKSRLSDISEIEIKTGPGSFTGLRVGITIANTLGFLLQIPINGKKIGEMVDATYA